RTTRAAARAPWARIESAGRLGRGMEWRWTPVPNPRRSALVDAMIPKPAPPAANEAFAAATGTYAKWWTRRGQVAPDGLQGWRRECAYVPAQWAISSAGNEVEIVTPLLPSRDLKVTPPPNPSLLPSPSSA